MEDELLNSYRTARKDSKNWKLDYPEYERLANNELLPDLDENLPETNDGSLSSALFKLPKRIVPNDISGSPKALDRNDEWINEFAKIEWEKNIVPNANTQAPFEKKWKDAVRKSAIYGSVPIITILSKRGNYTGADFVVAYPQDVVLEPGKVSDYDSDVIYWYVYYTKEQIEDLIKQHKEEEKASKAEKRESFNTWKLPGLKSLLDVSETVRPTDESPTSLDNKNVKKGGIKVVMVFNRGVGSTFYGISPSTGEIVREYKNPDPTGDVPVHYLYCYQDFINPYGIGIVKLAGGTQNVLDYMRQADVLATQMGLRPPVLIEGDTSETDLESIVYGQDVLWLAGKAQIERQEIGNNVYQELPNRIGMYKTSLNNLIPTGDTTISAESGDPQYSKTPAGVKFQQSNLSIDDEDYKDSLFITYSAVAKSMINTHFANKTGSDIMKLDDAERERIFKSAPELFPQFQEQVDEMGNVIPASNELEVIWDNARAEFDFTVDPEPEKVADDQQKLEGLMKVLELTNADPMFVQELQMSGKKFNKGELLADIIGLTTDNDKIITDISPEDKAQLAQQQAMQPQIDPATGQPIDPNTMPQDPNAETPQEQQQDQGPEMQMEGQEQPQMAQQGLETPQEQAQDIGPEMPNENDEAIKEEVAQVMDKYQVDENTALFMLDAEHQGHSEEEILATIQKYEAMNGN